MPEYHHRTTTSCASNARPASRAFVVGGAGWSRAHVSTCRLLPERDTPMHANHARQRLDTVRCFARPTHAAMGSLQAKARVKSSGVV